MAQINPRTFADAKQLADGVYELILTNWGNRGLAQDTNNGSVQYPPVKNLPGTATPFMLEGAIPIVSEFLLPPIQSLFGIAIAPRSDVDMCILNFPSLPQVPALDTSLTNGGIQDLVGTKSITIPQGFVNYGGILETEQRLSIHAPLIGQQNGPILIRASSHAFFADSYDALNPMGPDTFGTALNTGTGLNAGSTFTVFKVPELRLLLYLTNSGVLPPIRRAPFYGQGQALGLYPVFPLAAVYPCMGRRVVRIALRGNTTTVPLTFTVEGVWPVATSFGGTSAWTSNATQLAQVIVPAGGAVTITIDQPPTPFLTLSATGSPLIPPEGLDYEIAMFD